ncbi:MAG: ATP synthase F0 subunit B [Pseudomonadota bacterium]
MITPLPDYTFLWQLLIFLLVTFSLTYFVFKPALKIIEKRRQLTLHKQQESKNIQIEADILIKKYEDRLEEMRQEGSYIQQELIRQGEEVGKDIIRRAKEKNKEVISKKMDEIAKIKLQIFQEMETKSDEISQQIISKVIG